jgi:hypothetical protein
LPPIADGHLDTGKAQLANSTMWNKTSLYVDKEAVAVGNWAPNWNIVKTFTGLYPMEKEIIRTFGRSVAINDDNVVTIHVVQPLAAYVQETYGQIFECVKHEHSQCGGKTGYCDPIVDDELTNSMKVAAYMLRHDVE